MRKEKTIKQNLEKSSSKDQEMRMINMNEEQESKFVSNFIKTAKYNL